MGTPLVEIYANNRFPDVKTNLWDIFGKELPATDKAQPRPGEGC